MMKSMLFSTICLFMFDLKKKADDVNAEDDVGEKKKKKKNSVAK